MIDEIYACRNRAQTHVLVLTVGISVSSEPTTAPSAATSGCDEVEGAYNETKRAFHPQQKNSLSRMILLRDAVCCLALVSLQNDRFNACMLQRWANTFNQAYHRRLIIIRADNSAFHAQTRV